MTPFTALVILAFATYLVLWLATIIDGVRNPDHSLGRYRAARRKRRVPHVGQTKED